MTVYIYDKILGKVVEKGSEAPDVGEIKRIHIMPDIQPYKSMVDGSRIKSRSDHRDHLRAHGVIEVGNEKMETKRTPIDREIRRAVIREQLSGMNDSQASEVMNQLHRQYGR